MGFENNRYKRPLHVHYTAHTTNVEIHGRVSEHAGKYDTPMEIAKKRKRTLFGYVLSAAKETLTNTILQGKLRWKYITRKANKTEVGRCKGIDREALN